MKKNEISTPRERLWREKYYQLKKLHEEYGRTYEINDPRYYKIKPWISRMRTKRATLSQEKITKLNLLGFVWNVYEMKWEENFKKLLAFKDRHGHARVPSIYEDQSLANWALKFRGSNPGMCPKKRKRLEDIGFFEKAEAKNSSAA